MSLPVAIPAPSASRRGLPHGMLGDDRLARAVGAGDERAFATLFARYHQPLYRYCRSLVGGEEDAQDALQATMLAALVALRRGQRDAPLRPWLYRIAHNESISLLRRRRPTDELADALASPSPSPEDHFAGRARLGMLVADLHELPERQRAALVMRELSDLSHEEIAAALAITPSAAKQSIFEARRGLQDFGEGRAMPCEAVLRLISDGDGRALRGRRVKAHLRDCQGCAAFAQAIPARRVELAAIAPPLAPLAASTLLVRVLGGGSAHGGGSGGGIAVAAAGKSAGGALAAKAVAGVAIVATAAAGATGALTLPGRAARDPQGAGPAARGNVSS
ncbi:MAG: RNA polymerase sigma factor, partial [Solirubrobacteraceae bacterium]